MSESIKALEEILEIEYPDEFQQLREKYPNYHLEVKKALHDYIDAFAEQDVKLQEALDDIKQNEEGFLHILQRNTRIPFETSYLERTGEDTYDGNCQFCGRKKY